MAEMIANLGQLTDKQFENLAFDLLSLKGVENLTWRTPGRDGGRDLEGFVQTVDFSGHVIRHKWYFECKKYSSAISWPVVYEKVAYASNASADFLLFLTNSSLSPQCVDEVDKWNKRNSVPFLRHWPGHQLCSLLESFGPLCAKYSLKSEKESEQLHSSILPLEIAKCAQAAHNASSFGQDAQKYIELAACLADLLSARLADIRLWGRFIFSPFKNSADSFSWLNISDPADLPLDRVAGRAFFSMLHVTHHSSSISVKAVGDAGLLVDLGETRRPLPEAVKAVMSEICVLGNLEFRSEGNGIRIVQRDFL